jgi:alpha-D-ribose 1-methylphosphonate 5-triphosphate diphosphatase
MLLNFSLRLLCMPNDNVFAGQIVLADEVVNGWVAVENDKIVDVGHGTAPRSAVDLVGDMLIPGLIELHTDHLESHLKPRPKVDWPVMSALLAFDAQVAAAGITTVFDCLRAGHDVDYAPLDNEITDVVTAIRSAQSQSVLRAEHKIHIRCEICADDVVDQMNHLTQQIDVGLMSLMDHTPGARQFTDIGLWRTYYGGKSGRTDKDLDELIVRKHDMFARNYKRHRAALVDVAREHNISLASHDDAKPEHVCESIADKVSLAEFPTTIEAARLSHEAGIRVMMGAPNVVRGGSHSGNVASEDLARTGYLDALSSDYVPASLLFGAFELARRIEGYGVARALRTVTINPARAAGLDDRGEIAPGKRADLVRVRLVDNLPVVREVYRLGQRIV